MVKLAPASKKKNLVYIALEKSKIAQKHDFHLYDLQDEKNKKLTHFVFWMKGSLLVKKKKSSKKKKKIGVFKDAAEHLKSG